MKTKTSSAADIGVLCSLCFLFPFFPFPTPPFFFPLFFFVGFFFFFFCFCFFFFYLLYLVWLFSCFSSQKTFRKVSLCICTR
ncbi:ATP synthase subunit a-like [Phocoena sinus]|uniref:ATP synthase subunit a-like n=1 Tax=Phocoena sinus TaxID=42100 RepID=UPI0013C517BE|nr:ATP synthase subunit a-like [Phocoena sinus]